VSGANRYGDETVISRDVEQFFAVATPERLGAARCGDQPLAPPFGEWPHVDFPRRWSHRLSAADVPALLPSRGSWISSWIPRLLPSSSCPAGCGAVGVFAVRESFFGL